MTLPLGLWLAVFVFALVGVLLKDWRPLAVVLALSIVALALLYFRR